MPRPRYELRPATPGDLALARRLDAARRARQWSIPQLARHAQTPLSVVQRILGGQAREPSWWSVVRIAQALGVSLDVLAQRASVDLPKDTDNGQDAP